MSIGGCEKGIEKEVSVLWCTIVHPKARGNSSKTLEDRSKNKEEFFQRLIAYLLLTTYMTSTAILGKHGEDIATKYLQSLHYRIDGRNVRYGKYEIDIVAYDKIEKMIVFVEVKTRSSHSEAYPIHTAMHRRKRASLRRAIAHWVSEHEYDGPARIDLVSVMHGAIIEHIQGVGSEVW